MDNKNSKKEDTMTMVMVDGGLLKAYDELVEAMKKTGRPTTTRFFKKKEEKKQVKIGDKVQITVFDQYHGEKGTVIGPKGTSESPTYYYILLDNGRTIYKTPTSWHKLTTNNV